MQHYCQGETVAARFRLFLYELKSLDDRGITLVNPIKAYEANRLLELEKSYGTSNPNEVCLRAPSVYPKQDQKGKELFCMYCKDAKRPEFKACQELKADLQKQLEKDALSP